MAKNSNLTIADRMIRRHIMTQRLSNTQAKKILSMWAKARPTITGKLSELIDGKSTITPKGMEAILRSLDRTIRTELKAEFKVLAEAMEEFSESEADFLHDTISTAIQPALAVPASGVVAAVSGAQVAATAAANPFQGNTMVTWPDSLTEWTKTMIGNQTRAGFLQGKPTQDIVRDVRNMLGGRNAQGIRSVVVSAVNHYAATAREMMVKANDDILDARQWLSTLDTHTSPMCQLRDRLKYPMKVTAQSLGMRGKKSVPGSQYGAGPGKLHYCCRSTETWVVKGMEDWPKGKRPALKQTESGLFSEQVSAQTDFFSWVQRQPRFVLEQLYGIQRADQILKGVQVPTMFTDKGEMMTIQQMKDKGLWRD